MVEFEGRRGGGDEGRQAGSRFGQNGTGFDPGGFYVEEGCVISTFFMFLL